MSGLLHARLAPGRITLRLLALGAVLALLVGSVGSVAAASPKAKSLGVQSRAKITRTGTAHVAKLAKGAEPQTVDATQPDPEAGGDEVNRSIPSAISAARVPSSHVPRPATLPVADATGGDGFDGLNHFDQRTSGTGDYVNTQFSLEPPDQGLCTDGNVVLETVNTALRVRGTDGSDLTPAISLSQFFGVAPEFNRPDGPFGPFISDPKCYWDPGTGHWFLTLLSIAIDPVTGDFGNTSAQLLAVTQTTDPAGAWNLFSFDTTDDGTGGTPSHPNCPCLGDQPLIGADANGFYISTNEFAIHTDDFNGTQLYAMNKAALAAGTLSTIVHFSNLTQAEGLAYSMQPTTTPPGGTNPTVNGGTEYFLSALDFDATLDDRVTLWALSGTGTLTSESPTLTLTQKILATEVYGQPPAMQQKKGSAPLDEALRGKLGVRLGLVAKPSTEQFNTLNSNDDRMNQTVYAGGNVWGAVNTVVKSPTGVTRTGIAWFIITPSWSGTTLNGSVANQGYLNVQNNNVVFPAISANAAGKGLIGFTIVGPDYFPGVGYVRVDATHDPTAVNVAKFGVGAADGFTGEISQDPVDHGVERWGDYAASVADPDGTIWFAAESINQSCTLAEFAADTTCGGTRTVLANWGSFIGNVTP